jgi:GST-like protein
MKVKRRLDDLDQRRAKHEYVGGASCGIVHIAIRPWRERLVLGRLHGAAEFLDVGTHTLLVPWARTVDARPAVSRGCRVNRMFGDPATRVPEGHDASDLEPRAAEPR